MVEEAHPTSIKPDPPSVRCVIAYTSLAIPSSPLKPLQLSEIQITHSDERSVCFGSTTFLRF